MTFDSQLQHLFPLSKAFYNMYTYVGLLSKHLFTGGMLCTTLPMIDLYRLLPTLGAYLGRVVCHKFLVFFTVVISIYLRLDVNTGPLGFGKRLHRQLRHNHLSA